MKKLAELAEELQARYEQAQRARESRRGAGERFLGKVVPPAARPGQPSGGLSPVQVRIRSSQAGSAT